MRGMVLNPLQVVFAFVSFRPYWLHKIEVFVVVIFFGLINIEIVRKIYVHLIFKYANKIIKIFLFYVCWDCNVEALIDSDKLELKKNKKTKKQKNKKTKKKTTILNTIL